MQRTEDVEFAPYWNHNYYYLVSQEKLRGINLGIGISNGQVPNVNYNTEYMKSCENQISAK